MLYTYRHSLGFLTQVFFSAISAGNFHGKKARASLIFDPGVIYRHVHGDFLQAKPGNERSLLSLFDSFGVRVREIPGRCCQSGVTYVLDGV